MAFGAALIATLTLAVNGDTSAIDRLPAVGDEVETLPRPEATSPNKTAATVSEPIGQPYRIDQVAHWAMQRSAAAEALRSEANAVRKAADREDDEARCAAALAADVLNELADHAADDDAAKAAMAYWQLVAAARAAALIDEAMSRQRELIQLAASAKELGIEDGDEAELQDGLLELRDRRTQRRFEQLKLRQRLADLTGRPEAEVATASMVDPLPRAATVIDTAAAIAESLAGRRDLRAVGEVCRRTSTATLPAARSLLGTLSPGLGLALAIGGDGGLLGRLHRDEDREAREAAARRRQACNVRNQLASTVRQQTLQAVLDVRGADARLTIADRRVVIAEDAADLAARERELDRRQPGEDVVAQLRTITRRGERLSRRLDLAVAVVQLRNVADGYVADGFCADAFVTDTVR